MSTHHPSLPVQLLAGPSLTLDTRKGALGDFWFVSACLIPLILYLVGMGIYVGDTFGLLFMWGMGAFLAWIYWLFFRLPLRFVLRRWRGRPALYLDREGVRGGALDVRGGRLSWSEILDIDYQTNSHSIYPQIALAVGEGVRAGKGIRYRREVIIDSNLLAIESDLLLAVLRLAHERWSSYERSPVRVDGRPVSLTTESASVQDARLEAIARGEPVVLERRRARTRVQLFLGLPFLIGVIAVGLWLPIWWWQDAGSYDDFWLLFGVFLLIDCLVLPLMAIGVYDLVRKARLLRRGLPLYVLDAEGLHEPGGDNLTEPLPWSACQFAYTRRVPRSADAVLLKVEHLDRYTRRDTVGQRLSGYFRNFFQRDALLLNYGLAGLRPDELVDLVNAAIGRYGG